VNRRRVAVIASLASVLGIGCPHRDPPPPVDPGRQPNRQPNRQPPPSGCGDATTKFGDATTFPADASLVALVRRDAPDLAQSLAHLTSHVQGGTSGLAVPTGFALAQWTWEVPLVLAALDGLGVHASSIASVQTANLRVWVAPLGCPFDDLVAVLAADFEVNDTGSAAIATPRDRTRFAHEIVVRPDAILLCPPGTARRVLAAWDRTPPPGATPLRDGAFGLADATIRIAVRETGLLDPAAPDRRTGDQLIRVDGRGVDATLAP
jgi:hypothetical protein